MKIIAILFCHAGVGKGLSHVLVETASDRE